MRAPWRDSRVGVDMLIFSRDGVFWNCLNFPSASNFSAGNWVKPLAPVCGLTNLEESAMDVTVQALCLWVHERQRAVALTAPIVTFCHPNGPFP